MRIVERGGYFRWHMARVEMLDQNRFIKRQESLYDFCSVERASDMLPEFKRIIRKSFFSRSIRNVGHMITKLEIKSRLWSKNYN